MPDREFSRRFDAPSSSSTGAETVIAHPRLHKGNGSESARNDARRHVALVEGSTPHMSAETRDLLRNRLRIAAILFFVGFLVFLIRWGFNWNEWFTAEHRPMFFIHAAITVVLGAFATGLCRHCNYSMTKLRVAEMVIFGCPALFFFLQGLQQATYLAQLPGERARIDMLVTPWLLLIFTYAMFIPNTWQRAAVVTAAMALVPVGTLVYLWATLPAVSQIAQRLEYRGFISGQVLIAGIALMIAIVGVYTIGTLRREVFAARQLGQYRLKQRLGSGGMGEVYLAEHQMMKRPCAVKLIRPEKAGDPRMLARFEREVRATAKLSHWNSIDIYDYGRTADGTFYYVMEFLPGHNVGEIVEEYGPIPGAAWCTLWIRCARR